LKRIVEAMKRPENEKKRYQTFEDLEVYQVAREFRRAMYRVAKQLPDEEKFGLCSQTRRAAVSLTNNIAEGHGRFHFLEQIKFMLQARGSLEELIDDLNSCTDENYFPAKEIEKLKSEGCAFTNSSTVTFDSCAAGLLKVLPVCKNLHPITN
jgi:four helix bundle protein